MTRQRRCLGTYSVRKIKQAANPLSPQAQSADGTFASCTLTVTSTIIYHSPDHHLPRVIFVPFTRAFIMPDDNPSSDSPSSSTTAKVDNNFTLSTAPLGPFHQLNTNYFAGTEHGLPIPEQLSAEITDLHERYNLATGFLEVMQIFINIQPMYEQLLDGAQITLHAANAPACNPSTAKALHAVHSSASRVIDEFQLLAAIIVSEADGATQRRDAIASRLTHLCALSEEHRRSLDEPPGTRDSIVIKLESPTSYPLSLFSDPAESGQVENSISDIESALAPTNLLVLSVDKAPGELAEATASLVSVDAFLPVERINQRITELREEWQLGSDKLDEFRHALVRRNTQPALKALMQHLPNRGPLRALAASLDPPDFFVQQCAAIDPDDLDKVVTAAVLVVALRFARSMEFNELNLSIITPSFDKHGLDQAFWNRYPNMTLATIIAIDRAGTLDQLPASLATAHANLGFNLQRAYRTSSRAAGNDVTPTVFDDKAEYQDEHIPAAAWPVPRPCDLCNQHKALSSRSYKLRVCYAIVGERLCAACVQQHNSSKHCPIDLVDRSAPQPTS
ncbi:hypothetical protein BKA62DRAFT_670363 [Auriculariales sp. MPI-PUGE-AT-0066]|nr:hypothetical protein BKA62DRAFT_670363 [Auriculariales sp. MPI-PUGE-AT-0066]